MQTAGALLVAVITAVVLLMLPGAPALDNGLGQRSPLGFNSWNHFGCNINESLVLEVADHFLASGMAAAGYDHINLDDCWLGPREEGKLTPNRAIFPRVQPWAVVIHFHSLLVCFANGESLLKYTGAHK